MSLVELRDVTKNYVAEGHPVLALRGVSLNVDSGEFIAVVGRSGCGKSTLLNLAGAMDLPSSGEVRIEGVLTTALNDGSLTKLRRQKIGFIFQSFQLLPTLSVVENVELPLQLAGSLNPRKRAMDSLQWVELDSLSNRLPYQLSGGQMQRVAIARALVHSPVLLLADEPTGNLDTITGNVILELLRRVSKEQKTAILMATHSVESTMMTDKQIQMRDGLIKQTVVR